MGVDWNADVVCLQEPTRERGGFGITHLAYEIRKRKRVWTVIRKGSGLVVDQQTDLSGGANNKVILTDIRRRGEKITRIVNVYNQKDTQSRETPARKLNWQSVIWQGGSVLAGEFNAHSSRWDPRCSAQQDAPFWEGVIDENGQEIGNDGRL
jgi:hypothetical protein